MQRFTPVSLLIAPLAATLALGYAPEWVTDPVARDRDEGAEPCDWREFHIEGSSNTLRIAYRCTVAIDFSKAAAYSVYIDSDADRATGYRGSGDQFPIGADVLLQGPRLFRYDADRSDLQGTEWAWIDLGEVPHTVSSDWASFAIPAEHIGLNSREMHVLLLGDNTAADIGGNFIDVLPDDALEGRGAKHAVRVRMSLTE